MANAPFCAVCNLKTPPETPASLQQYCHCRPGDSYPPPNPNQSLPHSGSHNPLAADSTAVGAAVSDAVGPVSLLDVKSQAGTGEQRKSRHAPQPQQKAELYQASQSTGFPDPCFSTSEAELEQHLLHVGLLYYPNHQFSYGLEQLQRNSRFVNFKKACIYHGAMLSAHPALYGSGVPNKSQRQQLANSVFHIDCSWSMPPLDDFDVVYDVVAGKLLHCQTRFFMMDFVNGRQVLLQAMHIAKVAGMLSLPPSLDTVPPAEEERLCIQLAVVYRILLLDGLFSTVNASDLIVDDSNILAGTTLESVRERATAKPLHAQDRNILKKTADEFSSSYGGKIPSLKASIFFAKLCRRCYTWSRLPWHLRDRREFLVLHGVILKVMAANADPGYKQFSPAVWNTPIPLLPAAPVSIASGMHCSALFSLSLIHSGMAGETQLLPIEPTGPCLYPSAEILYAVVHTIGRISYFFLIPENAKNDVPEPWTDHLPPRSFSTGTQALLVFQTTLECLKAFARTAVPLERVASVVTIVREYIVPALKFIGSCWNVASYFADQLLAQTQQFVARKRAASGAQHKHC
ncbi:hypothetical protein HDV03_002008 [Kappamyces sp. JEL0829]|nr:hypothetical protein HDV03_002008 [Kappamyces sp. JEL0829]